MNDTSRNSSIINSYTSIETEPCFLYEVKLSRSEIFDVPPFTAFRQVGEMLITSELFAEYEDCVQDCYEMLNAFALKLKEADDREWIVATKINPLHDPAHDGSKVTEEWTPDIVLKLYLAEAVPLREEKVIKSTISATISVDQGVDVNTAPANPLIN